LTIPFSTVLAGILFPIVGWLGALIGFILSCVGFSLQRVMTPDLDVNNGFYGFFLIRKRFGNLAAGLYQVYWKPYALILPHRGLWSHGAVISTLFRMLYLFIPIIMLGYFLGYNLFYWWDWWIYLSYGVIIADLGHICLDYIKPFDEWYSSTIDE
jgi:uncharacterized metal-binding protein